jgi:hypothetical protein
MVSSAKIERMMKAQEVILNAIAGTSRRGKPPDHWVTDGTTGGWRYREHG